MDKKLAFVIQFLKYLTKKTNSQRISFEDYRDLSKGGVFKSLSNNYFLYKFFNKVTFNGVKWENYIDEIKPLLFTFIDKIIAIKNGSDPSKFFQDPIDEYFHLVGTSSDDNYIDFEREVIYFHFGSHSTAFFRGLLNLSSDDIHYYDSAEYHGDCYRPDNFSDDILYLFGHLDDDNIQLLKKIIFILGEPAISTKLTPYQTEDEITEIVINTLKKVKNKGMRLLDNMYEEYQKVVEAASCQSVIDAFKEHFRDTGIVYINSNEFTIEYDTFIDFLKEHPDVQTFSDLKKTQYRFIDDHCNAEEAFYEYENVDYEEMNREIYSYLDNFKDEIEDDEDVQYLIKSDTEFKKIISDLGFKLSGDHYEKMVDGNKKVFSINVGDVDYKNRKVILNFLDATKSMRDAGFQKRYKIPFNEISDYVHTEKLYESLLRKIKKII